MVVCKFFQQGNCRYGQNCRFDHVYGARYSYHATPSQSTQSGVTDEQLVNVVQSDIQAALKGGQWILSCYAPFKEKSIFPGLSDLSPEEARLFIYEAKSNNSLDQAVEYIENLVRETRSKYEKLLHPTPALISIFRSIHNGETVQSPFESTTQNFGATNTASSVFRSALQKPSVFEQSSSSNALWNQFGDSGKSLFAQATQNVFGSNPANNSALFGISQQSSHSSNIFGSSSSSGTNVFGIQAGCTMSAKSVFAQANQNVFGSTKPAQVNAADLFASISKNVFNDPFNKANVNTQSAILPMAQNTVCEQKKSDIFGIANSNSQQQNDDSIYSKQEELTSDDLKAFESEEFELGFVPEIPPPQALCY